MSILVRGSQPPNGAFRGTNFMTPDIVGYYQLPRLHAWAELSKGTGMRQQPIWGVTVRNSRSEDPGEGSSRGRLSKGVFYSEKGALEYIEELQSGVSSGDGDDDSR